MSVLSHCREGTIPACRERKGGRSTLTHDDDFAEAVFGEEEFQGRVFTEQAFDAAVIERAAELALAALVDLQLLGGGNAVLADGHNLAGLPGVEEGEHVPARFQEGMQSRNKRFDKSVRQKIK